MVNCISNAKTDLQAQLQDGSDKSQVLLEMKQTLGMKSLRFIRDNKVHCQAKYPEKHRRNYNFKIKDSSEIDVQSNEKPKSTKRDRTGDTNKLTAIVSGQTQPRGVILC